MIKRAMKSAASSRVMCPSKNTSRKSIRVTMSIYGRSLNRIERSTTIGIMSADAPRMARPLKMLLPIMLPTLMSELPCKVLRRLTINSGRLVPAATMVRPITSSLTFHLRANPDAPSVNLSAPQSTRMMPTSKRMTFRIIFLYIYRFMCMLA